jgi:hypothetical protein
LRPSSRVQRRRANRVRRLPTAGPRTVPRRRQRRASPQRSHRPHCTSSTSSPDRHLRDQSSGERI